MEDWQQWQLRADEVAAALDREVDELEQRFLTEAADPTFRTFWPRFRDLKDRVRTAPAIKLDAKLDLERRLRQIGSRAYKSQEGAYAQSSGRKDELLGSITELRNRIESTSGPRELRVLRRDLDGLRERFDGAASLVPADRQAVWESWRDANNMAWDRLNGLWNENETFLRGILDEARQQLEQGQGSRVHNAVSRFFDALKTSEAKQSSVNAMKAEADGMRRDAETARREAETVRREAETVRREAETSRRHEARHEERRAADRESSQPPQQVPPLESWRAEVTRNQEGIGRLALEVEDLERQCQQSRSILDQAMVRGNLVDKRRKLAELERTNRTLSQRIEQAEESPLISTR
ncbi:MAG: hypothetical protein ACR2JC_10480 [Chloroflexota bacterium]|nr:MAG: hypothetical protein DLM70_06570 [Chloroflexota bacterium]